MIVRDLYELIYRKEVSTRVVECEWKILNRKVVATMRWFVDMSINQHVANDINAHDLGHKLANMYERKNVVNKRKVVRRKYIDCDIIVIHTIIFMGLVNQLASTKVCLWMMSYRPYCHFLPYWKVLPGPLGKHLR